MLKSNIIDMSIGMTVMSLRLVGLRRANNFENKGNGLFFERV